jgi:hypothetical protein
MANGTASADENPVWAVYDLLKTARLSFRYYSRKLSREERINRWLDILLAVTIPGSGVALWRLWSTAYGAWVWAIMAGAAALVLVVRPYLGIADRLLLYSVSAGAFRIIDGQLDNLRTDIFQERQYTEEMKSRFQQIARVMTAMRQGEPQEPQDNDLARSIQDEIDRELPASAFYVPREQKP